MSATSQSVNEPVLLRQDDGRVAILTLNRPRAMNALSGELIDALRAGGVDVRSDG